MTREEKRDIVNELSEKLKDNQTFYIADASGLTVAQVNTFRRMCFEKGVEYKVYKNTLVKKALESIDADVSAFDEALKGFSGIMFAGEAANVPAKVIKEYRDKGHSESHPVLKAASIDFDVYLGDDKLAELAKLKSKNELIGEVIGLLQSPVNNVVSGLISGKSTLAGLVKALQEREN
jgi:large subunit ribosomal protein L10